MAGLSFRDVDMVNRSMDRLGDSLLRERMITEQRQERETARADRRREFDAQMEQQERRTKAAEQNALTNAEYRNQVLRDAKVKAGIAQVKGQIDQIAQMHKAGQISTAEANRKMQLLQKTLRDSTELLIQESGLADFNFQDIPPKPDSAPADVDKDRAAAELEKQAAQETDPAAKQVLLERAKALRSGIGRTDPTQYIEESLVLERDDEGKPLRTQRRRIPANQTPAKPAGDRKAVGGYKIGQVYKGGLKYIGGDPNDEASWEKVR